MWFSIFCHLPPPHHQSQKKVSKSIIRSYYKATSKEYFSTVWWVETVKIKPHGVVVRLPHKVQKVKTYLCMLLWLCEFGLMFDKPKRQTVNQRMRENLKKSLDCYVAHQIKWLFMMLSLSIQNVLSCNKNNHDGMPALAPPPQNRQISSTKHRRHPGCRKSFNTPPPTEI